MKVADVERRHVKACLADLADRPVAMNRLLAAVKAMFGFAIRSDDWSITVNPAIGIGMNREQHRERYPQNGELERLVGALQRRDDRAGRLLLFLLLTGCRRGEALSMRWPDVDLDAGVWTKPATLTKQRRSHRLPLNEEAVAMLRHDQGGRAVLAVRPAAAVVDQGRVVGGPARGRRSPSLRLHDLRHWHASLLAGMGLSLPIIGALLGHSARRRRQRYAHLVDDVLKSATAAVGAQVIPLRKA